MKLAGKTIGERLGFARNARDMSQPALAEKAEVSLRTLQDIEYGKSKEPGLLNVSKIARALNITTDALIEGQMGTPLPDYSSVAKTLEAMSQLDPDFQRIVLSLIHGDVEYMKQRPDLAALIPKIESILKFR